MGLTMKEKQAVTRQMALGYKRATKAQKGDILDTLIQLTGYTRSYAARALRDRARYVVVGQAVVDGAQVTLIEDERTRPKKKRKRKRKKTYDKDVLRALQTVWLIPVCRWHRQACLPLAQAGVAASAASGWLRT